MKGKIIKTKAIVKSAYSAHKWNGWKIYAGNETEYSRGIWRKEGEIEGLCIGWTRLNVGFVYNPNKLRFTIDWDYEPPEFHNTQQVKVYAIIPKPNDDRYYKPIYVLPEDIIDENQD